MAVLDARTREGAEAEVLRQVREHGGFSIFWVTANRKRAAAAERIVARGAIVPDVDAPFPWCSWKLADRKEDAHARPEAGR